jgi:hypothetical protein
MRATKLSPKRRKKPAAKQSSSSIPGIGEVSTPPTTFEAYCYCIYGQKGIGKTTLTNQLTEKTLTFMFEDRINIPIRKVDCPSATVAEIENGSEDPWQIFKTIAEQCIEDDTVDCIVVDSVDLAYQACMNHVCISEGCEHPGQQNDFGATWNAVKEEFRTVMEGIRKSPDMCLVLISHCNEDRMELNTASKSQLKGMTVYSPSCAKACQEYLRQSCDYAFFYGKHGRHRAIHIRWDDNIWTAAGNDDFFQTKDGELISVLEIPDKNKAGQYLVDAFNNRPTSEVLDTWEVGNQDEEPEEEKPTPRRRRRK